MTTEQMIEEVVLELKKIMGDKYYEGAGTDFTAENIIELFRKYLSTIATKSAEEGYLEGFKCGEASGEGLATYESIQEMNEAVDEAENDYNHQAMGCGLEDRNITDRYEAMEYGFNKAIEMVRERMKDTNE